MANFNFLQDPRWPGLDSATKERALNNIFETRYSGEGFGPGEKAVARDLFYKQASDVEEALYPEPERTVGGTIKDIGIALGSGVVGVGEAAVGLADIPTGGRVGKWMEETLGYDPAKAREILSEFYSPAQKAAKAEVEEAEGFLGKAVAMIKRPSTITEAVLESAPLMVGGGAIGRGLLAVAPKLAPFIAGAAGEGIVSAGAAAEQARQETETGLLTPKQSSLALASGALTGAIGVAGGKLANKYGFTDFETLLARSGTNKNPATVTARIVGGGLSESFEELTQESQETVLMNAALDRPLTEGVPESAAAGLIVGGAMGAGTNILAKAHQEDIGNAESVDDAIKSFTKSVTAPTSTIAQEAEAAGAIMEEFGIPTAEEAQWEADIAEQRRKLAAERQRMEDRKAVAEAPKTQDQLTREARQREIEGIVSQGVPVTEGQEKIDRDIAEFRRIRQQEKEVAYLEEALQNKEVPQQEVVEAQQELDRLTAEFESRVGREPSGEIPIIEAEAIEDERLVRPAPPTREERLRERLGGEVAPPLGLPGELAEREYGKKIRPEVVERELEIERRLAEFEKREAREPAAEIPLIEGAAAEDERIVRPAGPTRLERLRERLGGEALTPVGELGRKLGVEEPSGEFGEKIQKRALPLKDIKTKAGKPFKSESSAKLAINRDKKTATHEAVEVEGGWVGREKGVLLSVSEKEKPDALRKPRRDQADTTREQQDELRRLLGRYGDVSTTEVVPSTAPLGKAVAEIGKSFGIEVVLYKGSPLKVNGFTKPGANKIYVNIDGQAPAMMTAGHEILHQLRYKHKDLYNFLLDEFIDNTKEFQKYFDKNQINRKAVGASKQNFDEVFEEFLADYAGEQFQEPKFWEKLNKKNPTLTQKLVDFINRIFNKIKGFSYVKGQIKDIEKAQDAMAQAMGEFAERAKPKPKAEPKPESKLSVREGPASIESPAFKKWFGDSVVTKSGKAGGEPLVVYHGTPVDDVTNFAFDPSRIGEQGRSEGAGFYFTPENRIAKGYAGDKGTVLDVYLNIKKPIPYEMEGFETDTLKDILLEVAELEAEEMGVDVGDGFLSNYGDVGFEGLDSVLSSAADLMAYEETALDQIGGIVGSGVDADIVNLAVMNVTGYDGVTAKGFSNEGDIPIYVAFFPNQVKSTDNLGTWSKDDPRIQMSVAEAPIPFSASKKRPDAEYYNKLLKEKANIKMAAATNLSRFSSMVRRGADKYLGSISTRLGKVSVKLKNKLRELDYNIGTNFSKDTLSVKPLLTKAKKNMTSKDFKIWDSARKNSDIDKINELIKKYDLRKEYNAYRKTVDRIRDEAIDVGLEVGKIEEYAPRILKDSEGFLKALGKDPEFPILTRRVKERAMELGITYSELTADQRADLISNMLLGSEAGLAGIAHTKTRKLDTIPVELDRYYMDSDAALMQYLYSMRKGIEARKFFGRVPEKVKKAKTRLNAALKKIRELDPVKDKKKINNLMSNVYAYRNQLDTYKNQRDYTENIGSYIDELIINKEIKPGDESVVRDIMMARFHERGAQGLVQSYKNLSYIDTMGSPMSALTQIGDLAWAMYEGGFIPALKHAYRAARGKAKISRDDLGVTHMAQEFADSDTLGRAVNTVFKFTGLEKMDAIGKETLVNASLDKYQKLAKKNPGKLKMQIQKIFGSDTDGVIDDLKNGDITENVKLLVFHRLLDFQPVTLSEMPEKYLSAGNGRVFYMLKTFTLKQFDIFRNEALGKIKNGSKEEKIEGMKSLAKLSMLFVLANAGADELKDLISGRKTDLEDRVVDNILRLGGISKFVTWQARTEGIGTALAKQILPPFKFANSLSKDIASAGDGKGLEVVSSIPILGKLAYWHIGRGTSKRSDLWDRRFSKRKKKIADIQDRFERSKNKNAFRMKHRKELAEINRVKSMQSKLNSNRRQINILKSRKDNPGNRRIIQGLESKRVNMIKQFLKE